MSRIIVCVKHVEEDKSCALAEERFEEECVRRARLPSRKKLAWIYARRGHGREAIVKNHVGKANGVVE